jgi:hypothetical protein
MEPWRRKRDDEYETPPEAWNLITSFIPNEFLIWEPFYKSGMAANILIELGFNVKHSKRDFFDRKTINCDLILTNPPYSIKKEVIEHLFTFKKPFAILVPLATISCQYFMNALKKYHMSYKMIVPNRRISYMKEGSRIRGAGFDTVWICVDMDAFLPEEQIIYLDLQ